MSWAKGKSQMNDLTCSWSSNGPAQAIVQPAARPAWRIYPAVMKLGLGPTTRSAVTPRPQVAAHSWMVLCNKALPRSQQEPPALAAPLHSLLLSPVHYVRAAFEKTV